MLSHSTCTALYVKANTDNQFCCVLEVAERARERKIEQLEALNPIPPGNALPPIQQAIIDLALEIEASGGAAVHKLNAVDPIA